MLKSGIFRYPRNGTDASPSHVESLIVRLNSLSDLSHWQTFILDRRDRLAALDPLYEYACRLKVHDFVGLKTSQMGGSVGGNVDGDDRGGGGGGGGGRGTY
jgi:hypothetical protein